MTASVRRPKGDRSRLGLPLNPPLALRCNLCALQREASSTSLSAVGRDVTVDDVTAAGAARTSTTNVDDDDDDEPVPDYNDVVVLERRNSETPADQPAMSVCLIFHCLDR